MDRNRSETIPNRSSTDLAALQSLILRARNFMAGTPPLTSPVLEATSITDYEQPSAENDYSFQGTVTLEVTTCSGKTVLISCNRIDAFNLCILIYGFEGVYNIKDSTASTSSPYKYPGLTDRKLGRCGHTARTIHFHILRAFSQSGAPNNDEIAKLSSKVRNISYSIGRYIAKYDTEHTMGLAALSCLSWEGKMRGHTPLAVLASLLMVAVDENDSCMNHLRSMYGIEVTDGRLDFIPEYLRPIQIVNKPVVSEPGIDEQQVGVQPNLAELAIRQQQRAEGAARSAGQPLDFLSRLALIMNSQQDEMPTTGVGPEEPQDLFSRLTHIMNSQQDEKTVSRQNNDNEFQVDEQEVLLSSQNKAESAPKAEEILLSSQPLEAINREFRTLFT